MLRRAKTGPPVSAFQAAIRGECTVLRDHICKEMNELNLERCRCIPKGVPGADWRVLQEIVAAQPERATFKACLTFWALLPPYPPALAACKPSCTQNSLLLVLTLGAGSVLRMPC